MVVLQRLEGEIGEYTVGVDHDIAALVRAIGYIGGGKIEQAGEDGLDLRHQRAFRGFQRRNRVL